MTRERELLARIVNENMAQYYFSSLVNDIKELLEQPEQEPVAWQETLIEHFQSAFDSEMYQTDDGKALILLEDAICYVEEFAPPKRNSKSDDDSYYRHIKEHKQQCEDDFINHQYEDDE